MFIVTARVPRKRLLAGAVTVLCCCLAAAAALIFVSESGSVSTAAEVGGVHSGEDRVAYLAELGWQVSDPPARVEELLIPEEFDDSYGEYLALQTAQGFDLTQYCGKGISRYIYDIANYPGSEVGVQAALLVYRNRVIGGHLQAVDGSFVLPLLQSSGQQKTGLR